MELHIMDASAYLYQGIFGNKRGVAVSRGVREHEGMWEERAFPASGVAFLLKNIYALHKPDSTIMVVFDRTPTIKREMYKNAFGDEYGYKGNRETSGEIRKSIRFQKDFAEACCRKMDLWVQAADGYEADDVIYTIVNMYKDDYSHVYVHTRDSDLTFLVSENVSIAKCDELGKDIDIFNYAYTARSKCNTEYNTIHLNKLIKGDTADNIPGIGKEWAEYINKHISKETTPKLGDLNYARDVLRKAIKDNSFASNSHLVIPTFNILCPLVVPYEMIDDFEHEPNWEMLLSYFIHAGSIHPEYFVQESDRWGCEQLIEEYLTKYEEMG